MTLSELRFVVSVAKEKNFRRAATKSFVSQPALSLAIKKIENELGVLIFERNRMGISITTVGVKIVNQAQIVLEEADKIKAISIVEKNTQQVEVKIGLIYSIAPYLLPSIIPLVKSTSPEIILDAEEDITTNLVKKLDKGLIDAAIIALPMALAFGLQSGLGAEYGLYTAIILAIIASLIAGTKTLISDPTGPMTIVAATIIASAGFANNLSASSGEMPSWMIVVTTIGICTSGYISIGIAK